jgi:hypothetical protein
VGGILTAILGAGAFFIPAIVGVEDGRGDVDVETAESILATSPVKASAD